MLLKDAKIGRTYTVKSIHLPFSVGAASGSFRNDPADRYFCTEPKRERNFDY